MYQSDHKVQWDSLHKDDSKRLKYPSEQVIRFVKSNFKVHVGETHLLDLGCGTGRHTLFMLGEGYKVTSTDLSDESVKYTEELVLKNGWQAEVRQASITELPFDSESFSGIVCHGVLLYLTSEDIRISIKEIHRVLKPGGKALVVVRSLRDMRYGKGIEIEKDTFKLTDNFTNELGMTMHFFSSNEIKEIFNEFSDVQIGLSEMSMSSLSDFNSDYLIVVTK